MSFWLEKIKPSDIAKLWKRLKADVKDVRRDTLSGRWASGITSKAGFPVVAIAYTTPNGFALHFIADNTSKSAGSKR